MNVFSSSSRVLKSASNGNPKLFNKVFMGINPYRGGGDRTAAKRLHKCFDCGGCGQGDYG